MTVNIYTVKIYLLIQLTVMDVTVSHLFSVHLSSLVNQNEKKILKKNYKGKMS